MKNFKPKKQVVIYHRADYDGLFSAAVCQEFLGHEQIEGWQNPMFIGWDYHDPIPVIPDDIDELIMVDISVAELMGHPKLTWIDHHKTAIDQWGGDCPYCHGNLDGADRGSTAAICEKCHRVVESQQASFIPGYRIDGVAACRLAYQYFSHRDKGFDLFSLPSKEMFVNRELPMEPLAIRLAGEYDVWDQRDPDAKSFQFGLNAFNIKDFKRLIQLMDYPVETDLLVTAGRASEQWQFEFAKGICKEYAYVREIDGIKFAILASVHSRNSTWYPDEALPPEAEALLNFRYNGNDEVVFSLYHRETRKDLDLSVVAKARGGGGHRGACGFRLPRKEGFELIT